MKVFLFQASQRAANMTYDEGRRVPTSYVYGEPTQTPTFYDAATQYVNPIWDLDYQDSELPQVPER